MVYCEKACQKLHWFTHKKVCKKLQEQREKQETEAEKLRMQQSKGTRRPESVQSSRVWKRAQSKGTTSHRGPESTSSTPLTESFYQSCSPSPVSVSEEDREVQEAAEATQKLILETSSDGNLSDSAAEITKAASIEDAAN